MVSMSNQEESMKGEKKIHNPNFNSRGRVKKGRGLARSKSKVSSDDKLRQEKSYSELKREEKGA